MRGVILLLSLKLHPYLSYRPMQSSRTFRVNLTSTSQQFQSYPVEVAHTETGIRSQIRTSARRLLQTYFSTRKLPITRASIPELKNVRTASVGVFTMASPLRLNEVFMTTGTPVRLPNSLIRFQ